ncbi:hypothetical protein [Thiocystis minor]|uniref:hypothetical protein n=1 Tax=Thiocystis minor TaxID=61597 RepID=UPI001912A039|nr:hypothetical protein [Thiocystis minor]
MQNRIESRIEKLENAMGAGAARVVLVFGDDAEPPEVEGAVVVVRVVFGKGGAHDD